MVQFARRWYRTILPLGSMNMETIDLAAAGPHGASGERRSIGTVLRPASASSLVQIVGRAIEPDALTRREGELIALAVIHI